MAPSRLLRGEATHGAIVAKRGGYEIWGRRVRGRDVHGNNMGYQISFSVYNRDTKKGVSLPAQVGQNLEKIKAHVDKLIEAESESV